MNRFDTEINFAGDDLRGAGFKTGDKVTVVKTDEVKRLEQDIADLTREKKVNDDLARARIQELQTFVESKRKDLDQLDKASTAFVVKKQDGTYVRRGKTALYITYSRSMAKHRASAFLGSTVHEVKLVISPEHVASTCSGCGRTNHG